MKRISLILLFARKYFLSRKNAHFINILSLVSVLSLAVGTGALFVILSVFNGMSDLIRGVHQSFDSEILITSTHQKSFDLTPDLLQKINATEGIAVVTEVIEDEAFVSFNSVQKVVKVKGVSANFFLQNNLNDYLLDTLPQFVRGDSILLQNDTLSCALIGVGLQHELGINIHQNMFPIEIYYPKRNKKVLKGTPDSFNRVNISAGGVFAIERQYDDNYIIVPIDYASSLFDYTTERTSIEIKTVSPTAVNATIEKLRLVLGQDFKVLDSDQRHVSLYKAIKVEKLVVFIILSFVLCVAAINIFLTITMIVLSKKKDVSILKSFGANNRMIQLIFLTEGGLIGFFGAGIGVLLGFIICYLQQEYNVVELNAEATLVSAFPVKMQLVDLIVSFCVTVFIAVLISIYPAYKASQIELRNEL